MKEAENVKKLTEQRNLLTKLLELATVTDSSVGLTDLIAKKERELKRIAVCKVHTNEIKKIKINKNGDGKLREYWQTNTPWTKSGKLRKAQEDDLYDALYLHYYGEETIVEKTPSVETIFYKWVADRREKRSVEELTIVHNIADWKKYISGAAFAIKSITEVKISEIVDHYERIVGKENISKSTFTNIKTVVNGTFGYAINHDYNCVNPKTIDTNSIIKRCKPPKDNSDEYYTQADKTKLLCYLESLPEQTVYTLAARLTLCLAARIGEYRAMHWEDYDPEAKILYLHRQMTDEPANGRNRVATEQDYMKGRTSQGKRHIYISDYAADVLEELRKINGDKVYILNAGNGSDKPIGTNNFNERLRKFCKAAGVPYHSSHKTRFGTITGLFEAGVDEKIIQSIAGHASVTTTRHYDRRKKATVLDDAIIQNIMGKSMISA